MPQQQHSPDSNFAKLIALKNRSFIINSYEQTIKDVQEMNGYFIITTNRKDIEVKNTTFQVNDFLEQLRHIKNEVAIPKNSQLVKSEITIAVEDFMTTQMQKIKAGTFTTNDLLAIKGVATMTNTAIAAAKGSLEVKIMQAKLNKMD